MDSYDVGGRLDAPLDVSSAHQLINETLEAALPVLIIEGEVAEFKVNQNKFVFFSLKDEQTTLGCFMMAFALKFPLEDGMRVRMIAQPRLTQWGKFSLTVREVMPVGEGSLRKAREILKTKLEKEGLFDDSRKRILPRIPQKIAVVSSTQAAGYQDFMKILDNRWGGVSVSVAEVAVQGIDAPRQIIKAIEYLNESGENYEALVIMRGGGSADDLGCFDHEGVVRAIAASRIPTLVGVGHEKDVSLADLAADRRAATPSNAAEIIVPDKHDVLDRAQRTVLTAENGVKTAIKVFEMDCEETKERIGVAVNTIFTKKDDSLRLMLQTLRQLDPNQVLKRGYSLIRSGERYITKKSDVTMGEKLSLQVSDGEIKAKVM